MRGLVLLREWLREHPWIWIVLLLLFFFVVDVVFVKIALDHPVEEIPR